MGIATSSEEDQSHARAAISNTIVTPQPGIVSSVPGLDNTKLLDLLDAPGVAGAPEITTADPLTVSVVACPGASVEEPTTMPPTVLGPEITTGVPLTIRVIALPGGSVEDPTTTPPPVLNCEMTTGDPLTVRVVA